MMKRNANNIRPLISIGLIIFSQFLMVLLKMEVLLMGYVVWKQSRHYKTALDQKRVLVTKYAKLTRPSHLQEVAVTRLTLAEAKSSQIIHMSGERVAMKQ